MERNNVRIESFDLEVGRTIARKYRVVSKLGSGWEGEVYKIEEIKTGIERAAKLFFPHRNIGGRTSKLYAKKLHKLRHCPILIHYHTEETITFRRNPITVLISEYVEGRILSDFINGLKGKRLMPFEATHLLYVLSSGMEAIHLANEYHGDLHLDNIIVRRYGLAFDLKLLDLYHHGATRAENKQDDICDVIRIYYDALGGSKHYSKHPAAVKYICSGLKRSLILSKFRTMSALRTHLEKMEW
ncbi:MAG: protein kinase [Nitrospirota bacterium]|nr:MAG: protein kinase [Nitrospirota bacterium]